VGAFFISMDFAANPLWRRRLFFTLSLNGGLLLLFGLAQRATSAEGIFWGPASNGPFFATYLNHSNAGAFINLTLPILAGQTFLAFQDRGSQIGRAFWSFLLLANVAAVFVNTSRASMVIGISIVMALALGSARTFIRREGNLRPRVVAVVAVVLACALILILSVGIERSLARWNQTMNALFIWQDGSFFDGRFRIYRVCWLSLPAAGWFGFGPGTFSIVFPFLQREHGVELNGILRYAHQDYLQSILEWGAVGFLLWAILIGGGIVRVVLYLCRGSLAIPREHATRLALCVLSLVGVLIHSLIDFPLQIASLQLITAVLLGQLWVKLPRHQVLPQPRRGIRRMPGVRAQQG
jgi:O-antigen ligase